MRKMLWDFECIASLMERCGLFETWASPEDEIRCPECGVVATRKIGSRGVLLDFADDGFPRAHRMWADFHEKAAQKEE